VGVRLPLCSRETGVMGSVVTVVSPAHQLDKPPLYALQCDLVDRE